MELIGKTIGNYQIVEELGRGGMGTVYRAHQSSLNRSVALKVLSPALAQDPNVYRRFKQEALATAQLDHPNIVHVYDAGESEGVHYIAMEYIAGGTLFTRMQNRATPLTLAEAVSIVAQIALALDYAHRHGILHRDVKPSNILLDREGRAVLTDLGIARAVEETRLTHTGMTLGTPGYMSPEQIQGHSLDGRSDLYSLGVVLFEILTQRLPFEGDTPYIVLYKHLHEPPPNPRDLNPQVPARLAEVTLKALAKDPNQRFSNGQQMAAALWASVPGARLPHHTPDATVALQTPRQVVAQSLDTARKLGLQTLRGSGLLVGRLVRLLIEALVATALVLMLVLAILVLVFSFVVAQYAQGTLRDYNWSFQDLGPTKPYVLTRSSFRELATPYITNHTFGAVRDADLTFAPPDQIHLSAQVLGNPVTITGTMTNNDGVPQVQLRDLNGIPLFLVDSIISNGVNQGLQEGWGKGPFRVKLIVFTTDSLRIETEYK